MTESEVGEVSQHTSDSRKTMQRTVLAMVFALLTGCLAKSPAPNPAPEQPHSPHWSYSGATGPAYWGALAPEYSLCATGRSQSPINIAMPETVAKDLANISVHYQPSPIEIVNNGHTIQVNYAAGSFIQIDGVRYDLLQFHFHSPSEHKFAGKGAQAELHLVHQSAAGGLAVVGVMIEEGAHNARFDPLWQNLPPHEGPATKTGQMINAGDLLPSDGRTIRYEGSLTTPPGTEGVKWNVMIEPITLSPEQLAGFRRIFDANNRPVQALNGRTVVRDTTP